MVWCTLNSIFGPLETRLIRIGGVTGIPTENKMPNAYDFQLVQLIDEVAILQMECKLLQLADQLPVQFL